MIVSTIADIQALLDSDEEMKEDSDDDVIEAGEEMDEDIQEQETEEIYQSIEEPHSQEHQSPSPYKEHHESSKAKKTDASDSKSSSCSESFKTYDNYMPITERKLEKHEEAAVSYADLKWSIDDFHDTTFKQYKNTNASLRNYQQILTLFKTNHNTSIKKILKNLNEVQDATKKDPTLNKKVLEASEAYIKNSTNLTELVTLVKSFNLSGLKTIIEYLKALIQTDISSLKQDTSKIKSNNCWGGGENDAHTATEEPHSHSEGEKEDMVTNEEVVKKPTQESEFKNVEEKPVRATRAIPISIVTSLVIDINPPSPPESSQATMRTDKGKAKVSDDTESLKKLVKASIVVCLDPDVSILVPYKINERMYQLIEE
ncbi:hypothetical protein Tco_1186427 [Tanacetum coccineum]